MKVEWAILWVLLVAVAGSVVGFNLMLYVIYQAPGAKWMRLSWWFPGVLLLVFLAMVPLSYAKTVSAKHQRKR